MTHTPDVQFLITAARAVVGDPSDAVAVDRLRLALAAVDTPPRATGPADAEAAVAEEVLRTRTGKVLTDADLEDLADEAEAGYDVSQLRDRPDRSRPDWSRFGLVDKDPEEA